MSNQYDQQDKLGEFFRGDWAKKFNRRHYGPDGGMRDEDGRLIRDERAPNEIEPGSLFGLRSQGGEFGLGDLTDRKTLSDYLDRAGFDTKGVLGGIGVGKGGDMLEAVNELAEEWGMTPFASLEEVTPEFVDKLEAFVGVRE